MKKVCGVLMLMVLPFAVCSSLTAQDCATSAPAAPAATGGFWSGAWAFLNSAPGIAILAGILLWFLNRIYAKRPLWEQFEGMVITAVKMAEKAIPDSAENVSVRRADEALKLTIATYEEYVKRKATEKEVAAFKNGIPIVHDQLDAGGTL